MTRLSICRRCLRSEYDFSSHRFMRHVAVERWEVMKIVARPPAYLGAQCDVEICYAIELHLGEQRAIAATHRERIDPGSRAMQDQRSDLRKLPQNCCVMCF